MLLIAHRGLTDGPNALLENTPEQIHRALRAGYGVEVDLWYRDDQFFLGHDAPVHPCDWQLLTQDRLWIHCKDTTTFFRLRHINNGLNFFFHDRDDIVLTSQGDIWTYLGQPHTLSAWSIAVMPEMTYDWDEIKQLHDSNACYAICSDYVNRIRGWQA